MNQVPIEKFFEMYGKACMERDIAQNEIARLRQETEILKNESKKAEQTESGEV